jgi:hypothetical protein
MHARQSVTSLCETDPAGNSEKSSTSRACFAFDDFAAPAFDAVDFFDALDATAFLLVAEGFFDAGFFDALGDAPFLPAAAFFTFDAATFVFGAAAFTFAAGFAAFDDGFAFFASVFDLLLVAAIVAGNQFTWMDRINRIEQFEISNLQSQNSKLLILSILSIHVNSSFCLTDGDERRRRLFFNVAERGVEFRLDVAAGGAQIFEVEERRV